MSITVLLLERSAYQRILLSNMLSSHKNINSVIVARTVKDAFEHIIRDKPEVWIIDIGLPELNDLKIIQTLMKKFSIPTIFLITPELKTEEPQLKALNPKAFDFIIKPSGIWKEEIPKIKNELITKVLSASKSIKKKPEDIKLDREKLIKHIQNLNFKEQGKLEKAEHLRHEEFFFDRSPVNIISLESNVIVMGASVGGPRTIKAIIEKIPEDFPSPILIVQHMNHFFMRQFAVNLRDKCALKIKIGKNGEFIQPGIIYLAQGDKHMQIIEKGGKPNIRIFDGEPVNYCRPSVDVLFYSAARVYKDKTIGILLTGMGNDGVAGLKAIKQIGGKTISESVETAVLYGMPKVAAESGVSDFIVPNYLISNYMVKFAKKFS
ncbi:MAG: chemotaxis-specific protein-glutamate methyltransferase CheB [Promethearchaeota archaeon]